MRTLPTPQISVVMPAYNAEVYLDEAVSSILGQTFRDFEFIIINDGSTDGTASILKRYAEHDSRIRLYHQENQGLILALNRGCRLARGEYIARMDADDISLPRRLERQLEYIEERPQVGFVGTWIQNVDERGRAKTIWRPPSNPRTLEWTQFFGVCVSHPTVLMRTRVLQRLGFYRYGTTAIEDVDLWLRATSITRFGNVPEVLLKYRCWEGSVGHTQRDFARQSHVMRLSSFITEFLASEPSPAAVAGLRQTRVGPSPDSLEQIQETAELIRTLYEAFVKTKELSPEERREISWDAAKRVASLAMQASRFDKLAAAALLLQAMKLNRRLLSLSAVIKGLRRMLQTETKAKSERHKTKVIPNNRLFEN